MSSKAYIEASKKETDKCRIAITNLYMNGINHDGHSWNTFGDIEDCLAVVIEEMYMQGARKLAEWLEDNDLEFRCSGCKFKKECESESADNTNITCVEFILAEWQKGEE